MPALGRPCDAWTRVTNPLFIGNPGTGKTFLARALAFKACQAQKRVVFTSAPRMLTDLHGADIHGSLDRALRRYVRADLLAVDDFAVLAMDLAQAKLAFQVIARRFTRGRNHAEDSRAQISTISDFEGLARGAHLATEASCVHENAECLRTQLGYS